MTNQEYIKACVALNTGLKVVIDRSNEDVLHATLGLVTETGEIADQLKKHLFYGKPLDDINLVEELGDTLWYISILANYLGASYEQLMQVNINKLHARYPNKTFSQKDALNRDLNQERSILETPVKSCKTHDD